VAVGEATKAQIKGSGALTKSRQSEGSLRALCGRDIEQFLSFSITYCVI
jgi:hypothetical protein